MSVIDLWFLRLLISLKGISFFLWPKPMELFAWTPVTVVHLTSSWILLGSISYLRLYRKHFENWAERLTMVVISLIHMASYSSVWTESSLMFPSLAASDTHKHSPMAGGCRAGWSRWPPVWLAFGLIFRGNFDFPTSLIPDPAEPKEQDPASMCLFNYCFSCSCDKKQTHKQIKKPWEEQVKRARASLGSHFEVSPPWHQQYEASDHIASAGEKQREEWFTFFFLVSPDPRYI